MVGAGLRALRVRRLAADRLQPRWKVRRPFGTCAAELTDLDMSGSVWDLSASAKSR